MIEAYAQSPLSSLLLLLPTTTARSFLLILTPCLVLSILDTTQPVGIAIGQPCPRLCTQQQYDCNRT